MEKQTKQTGKKNRVVVVRKDDLFCPGHTSIQYVLCACVVSSGGMLLPEASCRNSAMAVLRDALEH